MSSTSPSDASPLGRSKEDCRLELAPEPALPLELTQVVGELVSSCGTGRCFEHVSQVPIPSREAMMEIVDAARRVIFPGYFTRHRVDRVGLSYHLGQEITRLYELLATQVAWAVRHECYRYDQPCSHCDEAGQKTALAFIQRLPELRALLATDVRAAYSGDPAGASHDEIIFSYPGLLAVTVQRLAHILYQAQVPLLPRIMTEHAHALTGIDIHPGARIGESFFIDHGTGVVIGQTAILGARVRLYQGVTLGALSVSSDKVEELRTQKRHPTLEDDVVVYSGATILGGQTVIGARSVIGGNVWLTESVPPDSLVLLKTPDQAFIEKKK
jgi:serine O-acetyltransferase